MFLAAQITKLKKNLLVVKNDLFPVPKLHQSMFYSFYGFGMFLFTLVLISLILNNHFFPFCPFVPFKLFFVV